MATIYGVLDSNDCHIDISHSIKGAKRFATLNRYNKVSARYNYGYHVEILFEKVNNKWKPFNN